MRLSKLPTLVVAFMAAIGWCLFSILPWLVLGDLWAAVCMFPNLIGREIVRGCGVSVSSAWFFPYAAGVSSILVFVVVAVLVWSKRAMLPARPDHRFCSSCGYDLRGLRSGNPCPECAAPTSPSSPSRPKA